MTFTQLRVQRTQLEAKATKLPLEAPLPSLPQSFEKPNIGKPQRILKVEGDKKPNIGKPQRILKKSLRTLGPPIRISI